jgi:hypothetical protein|tara:strand:+ start:408 stop:1091 length:684 start_codon:yes stop_codon:yes gene_type:complete
MIHIDTVYQRVLALANKEQRGYMTPLEFNLMANQAQQIIFEQYFYDLNQVKRIESDTTSFSDMEELISNKLTGFVTVVNVGGGNTFPTNYRTGKIFASDFEASKVEYQEFANITQSRFHGVGLLKNPIYRESRISGNDIEVYNGAIMSSGVTCEIISRPDKAEWGYDVIAERPLYNASRSTNFQLHDSEETELVYKILTLAGITLKRVDIQQAGQGLDITKIQQEKI